MWTDKQIVPLLLHEDFYIREAALKTLANSWSRDPDAARLALQALLKHGFDLRSPALYTNFPRFPLNEASFEALLECLAQPLDWRLAPSLNQAASQAPLHLLESRESDLLACRSFDRNLIGTIQRRRELAGWSGGRLWRELQDAVKRRPDNLAEWIATDDQYAELVIEALATHNEIPDPETIRREIRSADFDQEWGPSLLLELTARRRLRGFTPLLLDKLEDCDLEVEELISALVRIGDPETPKAARAAYDEGSPDFQMNLISLLCSIRKPESEAALLEILDQETEPTIIAWSCVAATRSFSRACLERALPLIEAAAPDESDEELAAYWDTATNDILPMIDIFDLSSSKLEEWRAKQELHRQRVIEIAETMANPFNRSFLPSAPMMPHYASEKPASFSTPAEHKAVAPPTPTIRNQAPKVGRNDPCPCGSGKKHKKCCGANA